MTRIVAGELGGRRLAVPPAGTRPTSDRAREALFSSLESLLGGLAGVRVLDLYAGSGAVGLEAWSRGAAGVVLVGSAAAAVRVLRSNVAILRGARDGGHASDAGGHGPGAGLVEVIAAKAERAVVELPASAFDVVFADPP
jgi:16S rRNA (guanine966-N2)-methyltransferase